MVLGHATRHIPQTLTSTNQSGFSIPGMENRYWLAYHQHLGGPYKISAYCPNDPFSFMSTYCPNTPFSFSSFLPFSSSYFRAGLNKKKLLRIMDGRASYCVHAMNNRNSTIWFLLFRVAPVSEYYSRDVVTRPRSKTS